MTWLEIADAFGAVRVMLEIKIRLTLEKALVSNVYPHFFTIYISFTYFVSLISVRNCML